MDPQQRMLLQCSYRAIEDAGLRVGKLAGRNVSVFAGISSFDYAVAGLSYQDRGVIDAYSNTGGSSSIAANRISYCFDLRGPSVAVDTACSSSLVAMHMACESIWRGDAEMALAGGVNALILPDFYVAFSQLGVLSPDGRCKTFDSRANGYVRSEGAGMVMLKPLSHALRDGDPVYATVRSTALNQDGRTPGMTVPSQDAQETLINLACEKASIAPNEIQYVEAHGTGTPVGDPIEANAIGSVIGANRRDRCWIGSVKTNIGHLEAGAGIASVIKVALSLHHQSIPPHLHFRTANPSIDFDDLRLQLPDQLVPWESTEMRLAGINGFGYGGANAHIILESAPQRALGATRPHGGSKHAVASQVSNSNGGAKQSRKASKDNGFSAPVLLPISARSKNALANLAREYAESIESLDVSIHLAEIAGFIAHRRSHHNQRATACATTRENMIEQLQEIAASNDSELVDEVSAARLSAGIAFALSGQGPQWWGMGKGLLKYSPAFRSVIQRCDREFAKYASWSLMEELGKSEDDSRMHETSIAQPSIFAIQVALASVWDSWGVKPSALVGHSVGEIAAAHLSGALSFEDAALVAFHRGRTMDLASSQGGMLAAGLSADDVPQWIAGLEDQVSLAAINGPTSVTISGAKQAIDQVASRLESEGVFWRRLTVEYAFHSPQMEPVREELLRSLAEIRPTDTNVPLISTVTGQVIDGKSVGAEYWWQNVRQSVRFSDAMRTLARSGLGVVVEVGPHPVLAYSINECFQAAGSSVRSVASLNRQQDDLQVITKSLGDLYTMGVDIRWSGFYNKPTRRIDLPVYPFEQQRCWSESLQSRLSRLATPVHPLLGEKSDSDHPQWQNRIDLGLQSYLSDHLVRDAIMYPAAAMVDTMLAVANEVHPEETAVLQRVQFQSACTLDDSHPQWIHARHVPEKRMVSLAFRECNSEQWNELATTKVSTAAPPVTTDVAARLEEASSRCTEKFKGEQLYKYCQTIGLNYGAAFRGIQTGIRRDGEVIAEVSLANRNLETDRHTLHPAVLDSCFHAMIAADPDFDHTDSGLYLPNEIEEICYLKNPGLQARVHCRLLSKTDKKMRCDLDVYDMEDNHCLSIRSFVSQRVGTASSKEKLEDLIYGYSWLHKPLQTPKSQLTEDQSAETRLPEENQHSAQEPPQQPPCSSNWLVFMDEGGIGRELAERLLKRGDRVFEVYSDDSHVAKTTTPSFYQVDPESRDSFSTMISAVLDDANDQIDAVLYLWGLDVPQPHLLNEQVLRESTHLTAVAPVCFTQAWESHKNTPPVRFCVVTSGAQSPEGEPEQVSVASGPLIGLSRVIISEYAPFSTKLVDIPFQPASSDIECLIDELSVFDAEDEVMWRGGERWCRRFGRQDEKPLPMSVAASLPSRLVPGKSASIEEMRYCTIRDGRFASACEDSAKLQPGELEIEVRATALNFADVMKSLALYPGMPDGPVDLGAECSGVVTRVGKGCRFSVGDRVVAIAPGSFATHAIVDETLVAAVPDNLSFDQACSIPIAFLTAQYAMDCCAHLQHGDRILIHSATGGVGLAALQLAKRKGIEVFATAGTEEKRQHLRSLGVKHIMDSRSLEFGRQTLDATDGEGVDAVLNSLPGEAIEVGLRTLTTGGHFLEIGKRDIYADAPLGLYPFRNNLALHAIDLDQLFKRKRQLMGTMLRDLMQLFASEDLQPVAIRSFAASEAISAFKYMQSGQHIGKIVVNFETPPGTVFPSGFEQPEFRSDASYWVVGGLGGFGLEIAKWMVRRGARAIVLTGRSEHPRAEALAEVEKLRRKGVQVEIIPADVTQASEVRRVLSSIDESLPKLAGVIHTAMVLEDKLIPDLDRETLDRVLFPKVLGGWNLHQQTLGRELDCFIVFSSLSSVFGHAGQANYSAANALLDSLAFYRRAQGLPALVMNWGHLGEVGYLAERDELGKTT